MDGMVRQLAWEELPELRVVDDERHEGAEADNAVRVRPEEVVPARVEVGRLDNPHWEVVDGVLVGREAAHRPKAEKKQTNSKKVGYIAINKALYSSSRLL